MNREATFAGGCFWCMVEEFERLYGMEKVEVGYSGGETENPNFDIVSQGKSGHYQVCKLTYDDRIITYEDILKKYWNMIDPTDDEGQFGDKGECFRTAIFFHDKHQEEIAYKYLEYLEENNVFGYIIDTKILPAKKFYIAEDFHQNFHKKNPTLYQEYYRFSGRYDFIKKSYARMHLTKLEYEVTQNKYREKPFENKYFDNFKKGMYVDVLDGTPLFSSEEKIKGNFGWPTFSKAIDDNLITFIKDKEIVNKIEVRSKKSDIHLGYVINDTLESLRNKILSINSSAIRFIEEK